jgi:hypothetical protein
MCQDGIESLWKGHSNAFSTFVAVESLRWPRRCDLGPGLGRVGSRETTNQSSRLLRHSKLTHVQRYHSTAQPPLPVYRASLWMIPPSCIICSYQQESLAHRSSKALFHRSHGGCVQNRPHAHLIGSGTGLCPLIVLVFAAHLTTPASSNPSSLAPHSR